MNGTDTTTTASDGVSGFGRTDAPQASARTRELRQKRSTGGFSAAERAAMKERAKEVRAEKKKHESEADLLAKIAKMSGSDRVLAERIHTIVTENAPGLIAKTWYGMPAYTTTEGKIVCFFKSAEKFKSRYATLGFEDAAALDEGTLWPTTFAVTEITEADAERIASLVRKAVA